MLNVRCCRFMEGSFLTVSRRQSFPQARVSVGALRVRLSGSFQFKPDRTVVRSQNFATDEGPFEARSQRFGNKEVIDSPANISPPQRKSALWVTRSCSMWIQSRLQTAAMVPLRGVAFRIPRFTLDPCETDMAAQCWTRCSNR